MNTISNLSHRRITEHANLALYPAFLGLGFNVAILYVPFFALYFALKAKELLRPVFNREYLILAGLLLLSIVPIYVFGYDRITRDPLPLLMLFVFAIAIAGFTFQGQLRKTQYTLICLFIVGLGARALVALIASYFLDPGYYGYGNLYDPVLGREVNSSVRAWDLSVLASLLVYFLFRQQVLIRSLAVLALLAVTIFFGVFSAARAFFVILALAFVFNLLFVADRKTLFRVTALILCSVLLLSGLYYFTDLPLGSISQHSERIVQRFGRGLQSPRFEWYRQGLTALPTHPFGGFKPEGMAWFHNVFLDHARLGGWFALLPLLGAVGYIVSALFKPKHEFFVFGIFVFTISLLLMQQDVIFENNWPLLVLMYLSGLLLLNRRQEVETGTMA